MNLTTHKHATLIGLIAILLWSSAIGLIRSVSESLGVVGGGALIYSVAVVFLLISVGLPDIRRFPRNYLIWGGLLFVSYEVCLTLSIGYATSSRQAIEVGMVNYLWPAITMLGTIVFNQQKANPWLLTVGVCMAFSGLAFVLGGEQGIDFKEISSNIRSNKTSYGLALAGALAWSTYCVITTRIANGYNGVTLFFTLTAITLWLKFVLTGGHPLHFSVSSVINLLMASAAMAFGYAAWNIGILHGNVVLLAGVSYFTPVFSAALAAFILSAPLSPAFWQGAVIVCIGSTLCWLATRNSNSGKRLDH